MPEAVDIYSGGTSLLPDAAQNKTPSERARRDAAAPTSPGGPLPDDISREILSFAGEQAEIAVDASLPRPLRCARIQA